MNSPARLLTFKNSRQEERPARAAVQKLRPSWSDRLQFLALRPRNLLLLLVSLSYRSFLWCFQLLAPRYLSWSSQIRAKQAFYRAVRRVPAYAEFVEARGMQADGPPETDKDSYVRAYPTERRCVGGRIPSTRVMIDESSGSTGIPYNWVRGARERSEAHRFISYFATYCFGEAPFVTINAFSMGAWATGLNMGIALQRNGIVKNTGPDIEKILNTLSFFGPTKPYLICGYPPFLKQLLDVAESRDFPFRDFQLYALLGGEGMSEGLRDYLLRRFEKVYSGYGATDLEIGIAGETPVTVAIRRLARQDENVKTALFGDDSRLPMVFQYNPLMHYIEVNDDREVMFTITRSSLLSPRIRYNIHDEGGVARYDQMARSLAKVGHDILDLHDNAGPLMRLPFLWVYGRSDYTISVMGANIYPEDLESCLYADPELARVTRSFCQSLLESPDGDVRPCFYFEIETTPSRELKARFSKSILKHLLNLNADFREAWQEYPEILVPEIRLHPVGEGPFAADTGRIKQTRILRSKE